MGSEEQPYLNAGQYIGYRLLQLGCDTVFNVPGDFNLPILDALATVPGMRLINTTNELNSAYAADGYARATGGLGCNVTTFLVGALSAINGVAGSYAEELPVLSIVGVPSTRQYAGMCSLHHTLGNAEDMSQEVACYRPVTCYQTILRSYTDARYLIDKALTEALQHRKPVLLEVCRDIAMLPHASFGWAPPAMTPFAVPRTVSEPAALEAATAAVVQFFADKNMPLIVAGRRVRTCQEALLKLADATGWGVVVQHDAKGMFPEHHPSYLGCLFPNFSNPTSIAKCYGAADGLLFVGTHFNELNFGGAPDAATERRSVISYKTHVLVGHTNAYNGVVTEDLLHSLAGSVKPCSGIVELFRRLPTEAPDFPVDPAFAAPKGAPLTLAFFYDQVQQQLLDGSQPMSLMVDTGDSMLRTHCMKLPGSTPYELQVFAGNIGWACPAGLGSALAHHGKRRQIVLIGDGGLQMTSGEIGTYSHTGVNAILVCVNNDGYLIERYLSPIPESGYNYPRRWDYSLLAEAMCNKEGNYKVFKVRTEAEAVAAVAEAKQLTDHFIFIEVVVDKRDAAPGAAVIRGAFLANHFDMAAYRKVASTQANSSMSNGLGLPARHDGPQEVRSRMPTHAAGSSSCLAATAVNAAAAAAAAGAGAGAPAAAGGANGSAEASTSAATTGSKSRLGLLPCKRPADGEADGK